MCHAYEGEKRFLLAQERNMGCGQKAAADAERELADALDKVGLRNDKVWDNGTMPFWQEETIVRCARENMTTEQTIYALHQAKHNTLAHKEAREEIDARNLLKQLKDRF